VRVGPSRADSRLRTVTLRRRWAWQPAHRWKAPRVRRIPIFFAEARVMRPSVGSQARPESPSSHDCDVTTGGVRADRVGAKLLRVPAFGQLAAGGADRESDQPLARETSVGSRGALSAGRWCASIGRATAALGVARSRTMTEERLTWCHPRPGSRRKSRPRGGSLDPRGAFGHFAERKPGSGRKPGAGWRLRSLRVKARGAGKARKRLLGDAR
jgi:hypothetical protein